jgi:hypothetical protein
MIKRISLKGMNVQNKKLRKIEKEIEYGRIVSFTLFFEDNVILEFKAYTVPGCELRDPGDGAIKMRRI